MTVFKALLSRVLLLTFLAIGLCSGLSLSIQPAAAQTVVVEGNRRVDVETIRSYFSGTDQKSIDEAVKALLATGQYGSVRARKVGDKIVVTVNEKLSINRVAFEGNSKLKSEQLAAEVQSKSRGPYDPSLVQSDITRLLEVYKRGGRGAARITSRTVDLPNGRIDLVFTVVEGGKTGVKEINISGNNVYSSGKIRGLMQTTESNFLSWLKSSDVYDPDRITADQELIRRYYLRNGYADFRIASTDAHFDNEKEGWIISMVVEEGPQYRVSDVRIDSRIPDIASDSLARNLSLSAGDVYDGTQVEKSVEAISRDVARKGYAFSQVRPAGDRNTAGGTISVRFTVEEGPRVYVERINIRGNTRTRDYVIRREFRIGEGDPYNRVLIDQAERRLNGLGYFKKVKITNQPGSAADRVVIEVEVEDQPTGSFSVSGGYSTSDGFISEVSITESNFLGRGQYVRAAASYGQKSSGFDFSFTEPYFLDRHIAAGFDLFHKATDNSKFSLYQNWISGGTLRLGIPFTDELTLTGRYSLYSTRIRIPNTAKQPYDDCPRPGAANPDPSTQFPGETAAQQGLCLSNLEASNAIKESRGTRLTSLVGYTLNYSTLDNPRDPHSGVYAELKQDFAGLGGASKFVRSTGEARYYREFLDDVVGFVKVQGGNITGWGGKDLLLTDHFNLGPSLVRGFAPGGIGPRDLGCFIAGCTPDLAFVKNNPIGGTNYFGATAEVQFPIGLPKEIGVKGALFADAGTLFNYAGKTHFGNPVSPCTGNIIVAPQLQSNCVNPYDDRKIRASVGASLLWQSPLGPIRFDYAFPLAKGKYDRTQAFRFSGGGSF